MIVWWATEVECAWGLARLEREHELAPSAARRAFERLEEFTRHWTEIDPGETIRRAARRLLRVHPLRAAGALQLAAALDAAEQDPASLELVTLDRRLADAAQREGFSVVDLS